MASGAGPRHAHHGRGPPSACSGSAAGPARGRAPGSDARPQLSAARGRDGAGDAAGPQRQRWPWWRRCIASSGLQATPTSIISRRAPPSRSVSDGPSSRSSTPFSLRAAATRGTARSETTRTILEHGRPPRLLGPAGAGRALQERQQETVVAGIAGTGRPGRLAHRPRCPRARQLLGLGARATQSRNPYEAKHPSRCCCATAAS